MSEEMNAEIVQICATRIRQLKEFLDRGYFILFAEGDTIFPEGVKLPIPKSWQNEIQKCIKTLKQKIKEELAKEA